MKNYILKLSLLAFFSTIVFISNAQLSQMGSDIDGESSFDNSGYSISLSSDGNTVAIGAPYNSGSMLYGGHVRVYKYSNGSWTQMGNDINAEVTSDGFCSSGWSISISSNGNIVAIGAPDNSGNGFQSGHVRIYEFSNGSWIQLGSDIDGEAAGDRSGYSVSISSDGNIVAIGADLNCGNGLYAGHVRIFEYSGGTWVQMGSDIDGEANDDQSGYSISLSSDGLIIAIGAPYNNGNGYQSGHVRIYQYSNGTWVQMGFDIDGEAIHDFSGSSVSLNSDGNIVAIGAIDNQGNTYAGHVRIYQFIGGTWIQMGSDIDGESSDDQSGYSVSLNSDGNTVAIGAPFNDGNGSESGHVRIFRYSGATWTQLSSDIDGEAAYDQLGWSVSLSSDGNTVAIGAPFNEANGYYSGHTRIFTSNIIEVVCDSLVSPSGNYTWNTSGIYVDTLVNAIGNDSVISINLTVNYSDYVIDLQNVCDSIIWIDGITYTSSNNTAIYSLTNTSGCDSIITLDLTINTIDISVIEDGTTLSANAVGVNYQWINCDNYTSIIGENNQNFTATSNGSYAVIIDNGICIDTSSCYSITVIGIHETNFVSPVKIFPNPTNGIISFSGKDIQVIEIRNSNYQLIRSIKVGVRNFEINLSDEPKGIYLVNIITTKGVILKKLLIM